MILNGKHYKASLQALAYSGRKWDMSCADSYANVPYVNLRVAKGKGSASLQIYFFKSRKFTLHKPFIKFKI